MSASTADGGMTVLTVCIPSIHCITHHHPSSQPPGAGIERLQKCRLRLAADPGTDNQLQNRDFRSLGNVSSSCCMGEKEKDYAGPGETL